MRKIRHRKTTTQNHSLLAKRLHGMIAALYHENVTEENKLKIRSLEEQALEHEIKASLFNDSFIMIL